MLFHDAGVQGVQVDGAHGEELEVQEFAELVLKGLLADCHVLRADAVGALNVDARLIGGDVSRLEGAGIQALRYDAVADAVGALMHIQKIAHAVTGAVVEVEALPPEQLPGGIVEADADGAVKDLRIAQPQHGLADPGEVMPLGFCDLAHGQGSGNVCGAH